MLPIVPIVRSDLDVIEYYRMHVNKVFHRRPAQGIYLSLPSFEICWSEAPSHGNADNEGGKGRKCGKGPFLRLSPFTMSLSPTLTSPSKEQKTLFSVTCCTWLPSRPQLLTSTCTVLYKSVCAKPFQWLLKTHAD
jgi:hypothetical protein